MDYFIVAKRFRHAFTCNVLKRDVCPEMQGESPFLKGACSLPFDWIMNSSSLHKSFFYLPLLSGVGFSSFFVCNAITELSIVI